MALRLPALLLLLVSVTPVAADPLPRDPCRALLLKSSLRLSRTYVRGDNLLLPRWEVPGMDIRYAAEKNYRRAVDYVLEHARELPINRQTAATLNRLLTDGLVPDRVLGQANFRTDASRFWRWLESPRAAALGQRDPVALAEKVHAGIGFFDSFPDGNGRTARLLADLVLIQHGRAPALYTDLGDYFARGIFSRDMANKGQRRRQQMDYFREAAKRGQSELGQLLGQQP